jgi:hypothetical protein
VKKDAGAARQGAPRTQEEGMSDKNVGGVQGSKRYRMGVDVGTRSARARLYDADGNLMALGRHDIAAFNHGADRHERSSEDIWRGFAKASVRSICRIACPPPWWIRITKIPMKQAKTHSLQLISNTQVLF